MAVTLDRDALFQYRRFSLYNSPYVAHDTGSAIDLYPGNENDRAETAPSPVAGEVLDTRTVSAPSRPYATDEDHLILVDTGAHVARILHVDPTVEPGNLVAVGDSLGRLVRAGFFARWVPNHIHLGFRDHDDNLYRASGSLRLEVGVDPLPVSWDGTGTVVAAGDTWARLDAPDHPVPGEQFAGLESGGGVLDGGFPHYPGGGLLGSDGPVELLGTRVGSVSGRDVTWHDVTVLVDGVPVDGIALFSARDRLGVKLVGDGVDLAPGEHVTVSVRVDGQE